MQSSFFLCSVIIIIFFLPKRLQLGLEKKLKVLKLEKRTESCAPKVVPLGEVFYRPRASVCHTLSERVHGERPPCPWKVLPKPQPTTTSVVKIREEGCRDGTGAT